MYRTPTHEPRYKQRTRDRESRGKTRRYEEPRESSEGSSSDEDDESTDRYTEESEDTTESQRGRGDCQWNAAAASSFDRDEIFARVNRPEDFLMRAYYANERVQKHDKITQKNFLSPFPSFLIPPIYREVAGPPNYRFATASNPREAQDIVRNSGRPPRDASKKLDNYDEETMCTRYMNRGRKLCEKHKGKRETKHFSRNCRPERILTCVQGESSVDPSSMLPKNAFETENFSRNTPRMEGGKKPKSVSRENKADDLSRTCKGCLQSMENPKKVRRSALDEADPTENAMKEPFSDRKSAREASGSSGPGKVKEKLVYVVEEEGKDVTKLETDLFSVNEILTIKKDLLELSEFAKKLKKLKEMKRDAEKGKASKSACHCKPVAELLKNVNKRIEALEARQEELERGSHKTSQKGDTETESKKTTDPKTSSDSPPKTPVVRKQSAMTTVPSVPKTEMIVSRANFSNNSEIVNELMDIKTQLQKLEKRRMSKELTPEAAPLGESKIAKKKNHAIAVFSSRTYILTAENYEKTKKQLPMKAEGKVKAYLPATAAENPRNITDRTKENVANWLKSVSPVGERSENDLTLFLEAEKLQQEITPGQPNCIHCAHVFNGDGFESQEPQKNRASEMQSANQVGNNVDVLRKNVTMTRMPNREPLPHLRYKECVVTPSGRLFVKKSSVEFSEHLGSGRKAGSKGLPPSHPVVRRSASTCSVSPPILTKERVGRMKKVCRDSPKYMPVSHSKSTQELSGTSSGSKGDKTVRNINVKSLTSPPPRDKIHKENKNEFVKRRESNLIALKDVGRGDDRLSSSSLSELIRTVNLETEKASDSIDKQEESNMHIYSLATMTKFNFKGLEMRGKDEIIAREKAKERKRKEEEAAREAAKKEQNQRPGYSKRKEQCSSRAADLAEKEKHQKAEEEFCECVCCCKKRLKAHSSEGKQSENETCSTVDSNVTPGAHTSRERKRHSERRKRRSSSDRVNIKKSRDRERRREKKRERLSVTRSKEHSRRRRSRERVRRRRSKDYLRKSKSKEKLKKRKSKESCRPKKNLSKSRISCSHNRLSCKCQVQREPSSCGAESLPSRSCLREVDQTWEYIKPTVSLRPKAQSEDSIEVYLKRQKRKPQIEKEKLTDESCMFRNIFKSLRRLYPKFSNLQLGNFAGDYSERKPSRQQQQQPQRRTMECLDSDTAEEDDSESYCEKASRHFSGHSLKDSQPHHRHYRHDNTSSPYYYHYDSHQRHASKPEHLKNACKCVRVYLQSQGYQDWPGVQPHRNLSDESIDEISNAGSIESRKTIKSDFIFPGRQPESQCVGHSCERGRRSKKHRERKHRRRKHHVKCRRHHPRKHHRKKKVCVCDKCGNVHKRPKKAKVRCDDSRTQSKADDPCTCDNKTPEEKQPDEINKPFEQLHFPIFSFLKYFCKKPHPSRKANSRSSLLNKVSEIRKLKACARIKKKKTQKHSGKTHSPSNASESSCHCAPKLNEIEGRLKHLEQMRHVLEKDYCLRRKKKKKKKRKVKKSDNCLKNSNSGNNEPPECGRKKTRKKRKKRKDYCCPDNFSIREDKNTVQTYYCTCPASNKTTETTETNETNESSTTKTTTATTTTTATATTTTTATTATTEDTESLTPSKTNINSFKRDWRLKERLSSLQSLLNNFQRYRKPKPQNNNSTNIFVIKEPDLIDDCGKSSPMLRERIVRELNAEPSGFLKKIKKLRRKKSKNKGEDKKEKVKVVKEKRNLKSMSRGRRHR